MLTAFQLVTVIYFCLETKCVETHIAMLQSLGGAAQQYAQNDKQT